MNKSDETSDSDSSKKETPPQKPVAPQIPKDTTTYKASEEYSPDRNLKYYGPPVAPGDSKE